MNQRLKLSVRYGHPADPAAFEAWQRVAADVPHFARGGVTVLLSQVG